MGRSATRSESVSRRATSSWPASTRGASFGLRVLVDGRVGFASTNRADEDALSRTAEAALALARVAPPDEHNVLPTCNALPAARELVDDALAGLGVEPTVELGLALLGHVRAADPRVSIDSGGLELVRASRAIRSTAGADAAESDTLLSYELFGMAIDGDDVGGFDVGVGCTRSLDGVDAKLAGTAREFGEAVLGNLGAGASESYRGPVLFAPGAFRGAFVAPLARAASAVAVQRGRSALAGKVGEPVASPGFAFFDDPTDRELAGAGAFDREGTPSGRFAIVEGGVLRSLLYDAYAAHVDGCASTGHACGGARTTPVIGTSALSVAGGEGGGRSDMLAALGRGLLVKRFSGTVDASSGDFSGVAKSARWVEGGEVVRSVGETLPVGERLRGPAIDRGARLATRGRGRREPAALGADRRRVGDGGVGSGVSRAASWRFAGCEGRARPWSWVNARGAAAPPSGSGSGVVAPCPALGSTRRAGRQPTTRPGGTTPRRMKAVARYARGGRDRRQAPAPAPSPPAGRAATAARRPLTAHGRDRILPGSLPGPGGGIGRRAWFRSMSLHGGGGSNPPRAPPTRSERVVVG